jgi:hypothetical protein
LEKITKWLILVLIVFVILPSHLLPETNSHDVSIKLVSATDGRPQTGIHFALSIADPRLKTRGLVNAKTNSQGVAVFRIPDPLPERVSLVFAPDEFMLCSEVEFSTDQILRSGAIGTNTCGNATISASMRPKPGELALFGKSVTLWQRILREMP